MNIICIYSIEQVLFYKIKAVSFLFHEFLHYCSYTKKEYEVAFERQMPRPV